MHQTSPVRPYRPGDEHAVAELILSIQRGEFGMDVTAEQQPDLADIPGFYCTGQGNFWVAVDDDDAICGTIALKDIGEGQAALRKMFVRPDRRGSAGTARDLMETLVSAARASGLATIWLGTTEWFHAAHRFYERYGFAQVDPADLPETFPRMAVDTRFYSLTL